MLCWLTASHSWDTDTDGQYMKGKHHGGPFHITTPLCREAAWQAASLHRRSVMWYSDVFFDGDVNNQLANIELEGEIRHLITIDPNYINDFFYV